MPVDRAPDFLIVGNGVLGLALALELKQRSANISVAVVGPSRRVGGATAAAGAMLGCFGEVTKATFATGSGRAKFQIALDAVERWPSWLERLNHLGPTGNPPVAVELGTTLILNARGGRLDSENFAAVRRALDECQEPYDEVDEAEIGGLDALDDARPLAALRLPGEGSVDARRVLALLDHVAGGAGVKRHDANVDEIVVRDGRAIGVRLDDGSVLVGGVIVCAAGAYSGELLERATPPGSVMPIVAGSGVAVEVRRVLGPGFSEVVRTVNRAGSCGLHVIPIGEATEYIGATNVIFRRPESAEHLGVCHFLIQSAIDQLDRNLSFARVVNWRIGNRPVSLDGFPVAGWSGVESLYVLSGTYRDGFHGAPVYACRVADELLDGVTAFDRRFSPTRRFISDSSVEASIREFTHQSLSSWFESGLVLPRFNSARDLEPLFEMRAREVYDQLEVDFGLPPDLLAYLAISRKNDSDVTAVRDYFRSC